MKYTYRTGGYPGGIKRMEVVKETDKQIVVLEYNLWSKTFIESRRAKRSDFYNFFDTFDQAKAFLMAGCDCQIRQYQSSLDSVKARKQVINNLQEVAQ